MYRGESWHHNLAVFSFFFFYSKHKVNIFRSLIRTFTDRGKALPSTTDGSRNTETGRDIFSPKNWNLSRKGIFSNIKIFNYKIKPLFNIKISSLPTFQWKYIRHWNCNSLICFQIGNIFPKKVSTPWIVIKLISASKLFIRTGKILLEGNFPAIEFQNINCDTLNFNKRSVWMFREGKLFPRSPVWNEWEISRNPSNFRRCCIPF